MQKAQQIGRRTWLARVAWGSFVVWSELNFGFGRRGWGVAIGDRDFAIGLAHAQSLSPAQALRVNMGFVNAYVLIRGKEAAVVDTGTPNNASKIADVVRTGGLGWDAVYHVILTHYHPDHIGSVGEVLEAAPKATAYAADQVTAPAQSGCRQRRSVRPARDRHARSYTGSRMRVRSGRVAAYPGRRHDQQRRQARWSQSAVHRRHGPGAPECEEAGETHLPARCLWPRGSHRKGCLAGDRQASQHPLRRPQDCASFGRDRRIGTLLAVQRVRQYSGKTVIVLPFNLFSDVGRSTKLRAINAFSLFQEHFTFSQLRKRESRNYDELVVRLRP
jgi:Metallo-beta-lactamase superfamily